MFRKRILSLLALTIMLSVLASACAPAVAPTLTAVPTSVPTVAPTLTAVPTAVPTSVPTVAPTATATPTSVPTVVPSPTAIALTDGLGHSITLATPARRIVSLAPSNTEILFAIGAGDRLVARDDFSDYPAAAKTVPSIGSLYPKVNAEAVVALQPDLVLGAGITSPDDVKALTALGLTVYATKKAATLDDIFHDVLALGQLTGHVAEAQKLVTDLQARVKAVATKLSGVAQKPLAFYEIDATDPSKPWTAGPGSFIDQLISLAGANNAGSVGSSDYFQISLEQLVVESPDIIVLGSATFGGQTPALVAKRVGWKKIKAVKNGAVYPFDDNLVSRPGPRIVDGLETLAKLFHPELFK